MHVCIVPEYPISLMTGGLQVQAEETFGALRALGGGLTVELFNWSERRPLPDLYHFIGFPPHLHRVAELVQQAGRPYLCTLLFGGSVPWVDALLARAKSRLKAALLRSQASRRIVQAAARIVTITEGDAEAARALYDLDAGRVAVVPNGVADAFFHCRSNAWHQCYGNEPFVLCVGAIQRRKNQLILAQACNELRLPLVLIGPTLPGEQEYALRVEAAMKENAPSGGRWLPGLPSDDPLLISAFGACRIFVLLSRAETQPLSAMQAMAAHKPVLLLRAPYLQNEPFRNLAVVESEEPKSVSGALRQMWEQPMPTSLDPGYSWSAVAWQLRRIYQQACTVP